MYYLKTTMIYLQKHNKTTFWQSRYFKFTIVILIILLFSFSYKIDNLISNTMSSLFKPSSLVREIFFYIPNILKSKNEVLKENEKLNQEILGFVYESYNYELIKDENRRLKEALDLKSDDMFASLILAKYPQVAPDTLIIDKGSRDGVNVSDFVFAGDRVLIGKIIKVNKNNSIVMLNSFPKNILYGFLLKTGDSIEINGFGGGSLGATIPISFDVALGDAVSVSMPYSYVIAIVDLIEEDVSSGSKKLFFRVPVDLSRQSVVYVRNTGDLDVDAGSN